MITSFGISTYHCPVEVLEFRIIAKSIVHGRYGRSPHQDHHSEIVKLVPDGRDAWTVVRSYMKSVRKCSAYFIKITLSYAYNADSKKQMATPKKNAANTTRSATLVFG